MLNFAKYYWRWWLKRYQCKLAFGIENLSKQANLEIESNVHISRGLVAATHLDVGAYTYIRSGFEIHGDCSIGRFCSIGQNVIIGLDKNQHPSTWLSNSLFTKKLEQQYANINEVQKTLIGNDCWIGRDALIMSGVKIGNGAIIGARALVVKDVPDFAIVGGVPANVIKYRFAKEEIEKLLANRWWDYSIEYLRKLDFSQPLTCIEQLSANQQQPSLAIYPRISITNKGAIRL